MAVVVETLDAAGNLVEIQDAGGTSSSAPAAPLPEAPSGDSAPPVPVPEAAPAPEAPPAESAPAPVTTPEDDDTDRAEVPRGVQKRFDTLTRQREEARRDALALREQMAQLHGQVETLTRLQRGDEPAFRPLAQQPEPQAADYASEQEWFSAVRQWDKAQLKAEWVAEQHFAAAQAEARRQEQALAARESQVRAQHADYDAQIATLGPKGLTPQVYQALMQHELGPDLGYYLAQHPEDLQRLAPLPPLYVWRELGKLEARLAGNGSGMTQSPAAPSVVTSSPPKPVPLTPVGSGGSGAPQPALDDPNVSQRAWEAEAERQYPGIFGRKR